MLLWTFTRVNWIHCLDRFAVLWILCINITEWIYSIWTLSISWSRQYSCSNSLNIFIQTFCLIGYQEDNRIRTSHVIEHWTDHMIQISVLVDIGEITGQITGRTTGQIADIVDKLNYQLQWSGQIGFIIVSLYVLLRAYQLTVIIIFKC